MTDTQVRRVPKALLEGIHVVGAGCLFGIAAIHFDLYLTGYKEIPTIGDLFLVQVIGAALLGLGTLVLRHRLVALAGALFAAGTLVGYELFRATTIFGFHELATTAGLTAGILEVLAFIALGGYAAFAPSGSAGAAAGVSPIARVLDLLAKPVALVAGAVVAVALLAAVGLTAVPSSTTPPATSKTSGAAGVTLVIQNFSFHPADFTVTPGEVIAVTNKDSVAHTFTSNPAGSFDTGPIQPGQTVTVKAPAKAGQYPYECTIHTFMTGTLTVT